MSEKRYAYWHSGHSHLVTFLTAKEAAARRKFIREQKPENERELRLRLMKRVKGELPLAVAKAKAAWDKANAAWNKANVERNKAMAAWNKANVERNKAVAAWNKAYVAWDKAYVAWDKAYAALAKAYVAWDKAVADNMPALEVLHAKECKNCPWGGETIFTRT